MVPGAVVAEVAAVSGEDVQLGHQLVPGTQGREVAPDAGLVGDDRRVLGVGLAVAPIALGGPIDRPAGDVEERLAVVEQDRDDQSGPAVRQVDAPRRFVAQVENVSEQLEQFTLVVGDAPGQQSFAGVVDHYAVVMSLPGVETGPDRCHALLRRSLFRTGYHGRPRCRVRTERSAPQFLMSSRVVVGRRAANRRKPQRTRDEASQPPIRHPPAHLQCHHPRELPRYHMSATHHENADAQSRSQPPKDLRRRPLSYDGKDHTRRRRRRSPRHRPEATACAAGRRRRRREHRSAPGSPPCTRRQTCRGRAQALDAERRRAHGNGTDHPVAGRAPRVATWIRSVRPGRGWSPAPRVRSARRCHRG